MRDRNQVVIPLDLGIRINESKPVRKLIEICDELDYTDLYAAYLRHWRKIDPRTMFELLVFAYMNGIYSSRDIESACRHDIRFMWILQNDPVPDHTTIARFQNERLTGVMEELFYQLTEKLYQMGELFYKNMFVDGTKIEANANRYTFVWKKTVTKNMSRMMEKIPPFLEECEEMLGKKLLHSEEVTVHTLKRVLKEMEKIRQEEGIEFVSVEPPRELKRDKKVTLDAF